MAVAAGVLALPTHAEATPERARGVDSTDHVSRGESLLGGPLRGAQAIRQLGDHLPTAAARNDLRPAQLRRLLIEDRTVWLDAEGRAHFVEPAAAPSSLTSTITSDAFAPFSETFLLHSNPGASRTILLDFDGGDVSGTAWNESTGYGVTPGSHPAWDPAGDGQAFSDSEKQLVQEAWAVVAEDYAPFEVDVTTEDPGARAMVRDSPSDPTYGTRVLITPSEDPFAKICNSSCGGVAFLSVFDRVGSYTQPAWVFPQALGDTAKAVGEAASHEAGHNLGLAHDGTSTEGYYRGHGNWAPIMGVGYGRPIAQWSKGSYPGANNPGQDDLAVLNGFLGLRVDEASGAIAAPAPLPAGEGRITSPSDVDVYDLGTCTAGSIVTVSPATHAPNLDVRTVLYDASGLQVATAGPSSGFGDGITATGVSASLKVPSGGAGWVIAVDGVGEGTWSANGYDDYGSLGTYTLTAPGCDPMDIDGVPDSPQNPAASAPSLDSLTLNWGEPTSPGDGPITGYLVARSGSSASWTLPADARNHRFTGLAAGTTYDLSVRAVNAKGAGMAATYTASTLAPPPEEPGAPRNVTGSYNPTSGQLEVWWAEPASSGTQPISGYAIFLDGTRLGQLGATSRGATVSRDAGFLEGSYVVGVAAVNSVGDSPHAQVTITVDFPDPEAPDAPSGVIAIPGDTIARVAWQVPLDHGSPLTGYEVTGRAAGQADRVVAVGPNTLNANILGLSNGTTYSVTVAAINGVGRSQESSPVAVVPETADTVAPSASGHASDLRRVDPFFASDLVNVRVRLSDDHGIHGTPVMNLAPVAGGTWWDGNVMQEISSQSAPLTLSRGDRRDGVWTAQLRLSTFAPEGAWSAWATAADAWGNVAIDAPGTHPVFQVESGLFTTTLPSAPTGAVGLPGDGAARVSWVAPPGGATDYTVWVSPGVLSKVVGGSTTSAVIRGLENGTEYTFTVVAGNDFGESPPSAASDAVVPVAVPVKPTAVTATAGDTSATVSWQSQYVSEEVAFTVSSAPGSKTCTTTGSLTCDVSGLVNGTAYTFQVEASNANGASGSSAVSNTVIPAGVPLPPSAPTALPGNSSAQISWAAVAGNGSSVTGYTVIASPGGEACATSGALTCTVAGLANGTAYTFTVTASNAIGRSQASPSSAAVTPEAPFTPTPIPTPSPTPSPTPTPIPTPVPSPTPTSIPTPHAGVPSKMKAPKVRVKGRKVLVMWVEPASNGRAIARYLIDLSKGKDKRVAGGARKLALKKLKPGKYKVRIAAVNAIGRGSHSVWVKFRIS